MILRSNDVSLSMDVYMRTFNVAPVAKFWLGVYVHNASKPVTRRWKCHGPCSERWYLDMLVLRYFSNIRMHECFLSHRASTKSNPRNYSHIVGSI